MHVPLETDVNDTELDMYGTVGNVQTDNTMISSKPDVRRPSVIDQTEKIELIQVEKEQRRGLKIFLLALLLIAAITIPLVLTLTKEDEIDTADEQINLDQNDAVEIVEEDVEILDENENAETTTDEGDQA